MLIPISLLKKYVDINVSDEEYVRQFSLKSAEVDTFKNFCDVKGLVIGKIIAIANHPDSNHLHITTVDTGDEIQDIVCGAPNVEVGRKVIVAKVGVTLPGGTMKKAIIRGVESNGMNCSLEELGIDPKFQGYDGIYYLNDDAPLGKDPIEYLGLKDKVLEIELTPNRCDLLSIMGVAYDTKAMMNSTMHTEFKKYTEGKDEADISVSTETPNCLAYYSKVIKDIHIKESPAWLKGELMKMNIRPINNVVDVTNYVLMVTGQPLHAFDYDKLHSKKIVVKMAKDGDIFTTLDQKERKLNSTDIVITNGETIECLGGVMGGLYSEVTDSTTNVFLESATFNSANIKATSKRLDLVSESSMRFEKGVNPEMTTYALDMAASLFEELAEGEVLKGGSYFDNRDKTEKIVTVTLDQINKVLGRVYTVKEVEDVLSGLSFNYSLCDNKFEVNVPKRRPDIETYQDIIEEVVRINGYEKISATIPPATVAGKLSDYQMFVRNMRHILGNNLNEIVSYCLINETETAIFDTVGGSTVKIANPLSDDRSTMRKSLIPSLLKVMQYNVYHKNENNFLYEIGRAYSLEKEESIVSGALSGTISSTLWNGKKEEVDFFYLKGLLEDLFTKLSIKNYSFVYPQNSIKGLHPGVSAEIQIGKNSIGFIGQLHPETMKSYDLNKTFVFEIALDKLYEASHPLKTVKAISKYQDVKRDLALVMPIEMTAEKVTNEIKRIGKRNLSNVEVFDLYTGGNLPSGKKQLALSLTFSNSEKTFETAEVDAYVADILTHLKSLGISLRA